MKTLLSIFVVLVFFAYPTCAEYEDLRKPHEGGQNTFTGSHQSCASCSYGLSKSETKEAAVQAAKNSARVYCRAAGAVGIEFSNVKASRIPHAHYHYYHASVDARCSMK